MVRSRSGASLVVKDTAVHVTRAMVAVTAKRRSAVAASFHMRTIVVCVTSEFRTSARDAREHVMDVVTYVDFHSVNTIISRAKNVVLLRVATINFLYSCVHSVTKNFAPDVTETANLRGTVIHVKNFRAMLMD